MRNGTVLFEDDLLVRFLSGVSSDMQFNHGLSCRCVRTVWALEGFHCRVHLLKVDRKK